MCGLGSGGLVSRGVWWRVVLPCIRAGNLLARLMGQGRSAVCKAGAEALQAAPAAARGCAQAAGVAAAAARPDFRIPRSGPAVRATDRCRAGGRAGGACVAAALPSPARDFI